MVASPEEAVNNHVRARDALASVDHRATLARARVIGAIIVDALVAVATAPALENVAAPILVLVLLLVRLVAAIATTEE